MQNEELFFRAENDDGNEPLILDNGEIEFNIEREDKKDRKKLKIFSQFCFIAPIIILFLLISTIMIGLKLDDRIDSWKTVFIPIWLCILTSFIYLVTRWIIFFSKLKLNDNIENLQVMIFLTLTLATFTVFSTTAYIKQFSVTTILALKIEFICLYVYFGIMFFFSIYSIFKTNKWLEKTMILFSTLSIFILLISFILANLKLENKLNTTWATTLTPLWILFSMPIIWPIISCFMIYCGSKINCKKMWDVSRKDNSEGFLLTIVGLLLSLIFFPIFLSILMIVHKIDGSIAKTFSSSLVPIDALFSLLFLISLYSFIKDTKKNLIR
eukprot:TRINITY_DN12443_c0_g1_i1.p1 TRINITY_DN12443_c0_g1~~TRINITY_DN12443_c0_g1_i1.p1  ORF type:complete len:326 (-),score=32.34 TRINITY_DN12443_c0_g1_i1:18-995(-)